MQFDKILVRAWQIVWKHKVLWLFGILAGCSGQTTANFPRGGGNNYQFNPQDYQPYQGGNLPPGVEVYFYQFQQFIDRNSEMLALIAIGLILLGLVLGLLFFLLSVYGRLGVIRGVVQAETGAESISFGEIHAQIMPFYWRSAGLNFLIVIAVFILAVIFAVVIGLGTLITFGLLALCIIPLLCLFVPVGIMINVIIEQANIALAVEDLEIGDALRRGWEVVRANLGPVALMALLLVIGGAFVSFIISLPMSLAVAPLVFGAMSGAGLASQEYMLGGLWVTLLCFVVYLPVLLVLGGVLKSYITSSWTLTFLELAGPAMEPVVETPTEPEPPKAKPKAKAKTKTKAETKTKTKTKAKTKTKTKTKTKSKTASKAKDTE